MITIGAVIEQLQTYDTNNTLEDLLQSPEFITKVTTILESLPTNSKATARKIIYNASGPTKPKTNSALRAILKVKSIALPEAITPVFNECKRSPATFWSSAGLQFDLERHSAKPLTDFVPEVYLGIRSLETRRVWDTILWRYFVLFFHDLATFFNISKITTKLEDYLVVTILAFSGPVRDDTDTIRENIRRWTASGYRYAHLSAAFDDGAPFLLPQSVTDKSWEYELPLTGPSYEKVTEHLSHIGICTESKRIGADVLGSEIRRFILQPFQWMNFSFQVSLLDLTYATDRKSDIDPTQSQHPRQPSYGPTQHVGTEATDIQWNSAPSQEHNTASMDLLTRAAGIIASVPITEATSSEPRNSNHRANNALCSDSLSGLDPQARSSGDLDTWDSSACALNTFNDLWNSSAPVSNEFDHLWALSAPVPDSLNMDWNSSTPIPSAVDNIRDSASPITL